MGCESRERIGDARDGARGSQLLVLLGPAPHRGCGAPLGIIAAPAPPGCVAALRPGRHSVLLAAQMFPQRAGDDTKIKSASQLGQTSDSPVRRLRLGPGYVVTKVCRISVERGRRRGEGKASGRCKGGTLPKSYGAQRLMLMWL